MAVPDTIRDTHADAAAAWLDAAQRAQLQAALSQVSAIRLDHYRLSAVRRHLQTRMRACEVDDLGGYIDLLAQDPREAAALSRDILDAATVLFRDPEAYASLSRCLPVLLDASAQPRVWVPACGSGEDALSIAMVLADAQAAIEAPQQFLIVATDVDEPMLQQARDGGFGLAAAAAVPPPLSQRYLRLTDRVAQVHPLLVEQCRFVRQALSDPPPPGPFDLIDSRNLIGTLQMPMQRQVLEQFRNALRPGGYLLVGCDQLMAGYADLFARCGTWPGIYQRVEPPVQPDDFPVDAYRAALLRSTTPGAVLDGRGRIVEVNPTLLRLSGRTADELAGQPATMLLPPADGERLTASLAALGAGERVLIDVPLRTPGALLPAQLLLSRWQSGPQALVLAEWRLSALPAAAESHKSSVVLDASLKLMSESLIVVDTAGRILEFNRSAERLLGWPREQAIGLSYASVLRLVGVGGSRAQAHPVERCLATADLLVRGEAHQLLSRDGRRLRVMLRYSTLMAGGLIAGALLLLEDITEQTLLADELEYRSSHDALTGLFNRSEFERRIALALTEARSGAALRLLCYVDVDQFKVINDTLGHYAGDELLRQLATLFRAHLGPPDALARLGGDEFGILLGDVGGERGRVLVDRLLTAVREFRFIWEGKSYAITVSIGVAEIDDASGDIVSMLADADAACYSAKDGGRDRARWVSDGHVEIRARHAEMTMVGRIGKALDEGRFLLYYEDVVGTDAPQQVCYRELLVRMRGDDGRLVQPADFIAAAERYYLMSALDRWVIGAALAGIARLPADGVIYAINISGMSLSDDQFLGYVTRLIDHTGVAPERICFEITETAAISHLSEAVRFITHLAELGCRFALDDFGAGMASFSYLKNLPVQFVKIDGGFVRSMQGSPVDRGMVEAINRIGHDMGLRTIAEHVEDQAALQLLATIGVDWVQGKVIGEGRPFDELLAAAAAAPGG